MASENNQEQDPSQAVEQGGGASADGSQSSAADVSSAAPAEAAPADASAPAAEAASDASAHSHKENPAGGQATAEAAPAEAAAEGAGAQVDSATAEGAAAGAQVDSAAAEGATVKGAEAGAQADSAAAEGAGAQADSAAAEGAEAGAQAEGDKKKKRRRKKRKKKPAEATEAARPATDRAPFHLGEEVFGKVTAVLEHAIMVDLAGKALAIFDRSEMEPDDLIPEVGDRFVARVHNDGARGGLVVLTRKPLREEEIKPALEAALKDGSLVPGLITGVIRGGVEVSLGGLRAFAPASGIDLHPSRAHFEALLGQLLEFKVVKFEKGGRDVVVSRRPMLEQEAHARRKQALETLTEGQVMKGVVRTVVEWGAFIALPEAEHLEGLVHVSEASHDPRARMEELMKPGEEIEVQIAKIDERGKIWLSRKALIQDPWAEAKAKFPQGSRQQGKVLRLTDFGAFIELAEGVEGLMHVADMSLTRIEHPSELFKEGQEVEVVIHNFDRRHKKLALHPAPTGDQAEEAPQKIVKGGALDVEVVKTESSGVVVRVLGATGRGARGFIPAGHTGTERGTDLRKAFPAKTKLRTKVIDIDPKRGEPKLSVRALFEDEERQAHRDYRKKVAAESKFGTLGDLLSKALK